jgi:orotate phosphoribosyltransferase-like protein
MDERRSALSAAEYARIQQEYGGKHVATVGADVVASGDTAAEMLRDLKAKGLDAREVVFRHIRPKGVVCVY